MQTSKKLRVAIVGTGQIAQQHLDFLCSSEYVQIVGVADLSLCLARYVSEYNHIPAAYNDYQRMLKEKRPDVVHVLTPPHTHVKIVSDCLNAGAHVIVEKPIAPTNAEFKYLWKTACEQRRILFEDHNYKFNDTIKALEGLWKRGAIGKIREIEIRIVLQIRSNGSRYADLNMPHPSHTLPAGVLHEFITHMCYLALLFVPNTKNSVIDEFDHVTAVWRNAGGGSLFKYDDLEAGFEENGIRVRLRFASQTWPECFTIALRGTAGLAETDLFQPYLRLYRMRSVGPITSILNQWEFGSELKKAAIRNFFNKLTQKTPYHGLMRFLLTAYRAIRTGSKPPVTFEEMDRTTRLIDNLIAAGVRR